MEPGEPEAGRPADGPHERAFDAQFAAILAGLVAGDETPLARLFAETRDPPPRIVWDPATEALPDPTLRTVHACWNALRAGRAMPDWGDLKAETLGVDLVHLAIVDPADGDDFRFVVYGSAVTSAALRDYRGETVREMGLRARTPGPVLYRAVYAMMVRRPVPVFTWNAAPPWQDVAGWNRLVVPFAHPDGDGLRFVSCIKGEGNRAAPPEVRREGRARLADRPKRP